MNEDEEANLAELIHTVVLAHPSGMLERDVKREFVKNTGTELSLGSYRNLAEFARNHREHFQVSGQLIVAIQDASTAHIVNHISASSNSNTNSRRGARGGGRGGRGGGNAVFGRGRGGRITTSSFYDPRGRGGGASSYQNRGGSSYSNSSFNIQTPHYDGGRPRSPPYQQRQRSFTPPAERRSPYERERRRSPSPSPPRQQWNELRREHYSPEYRRERSPPPPAGNPFAPRAVPPRRNNQYDHRENYDDRNDNRRRYDHMESGGNRHEYQQEYNDDYYYRGERREFDENKREWQAERNARDYREESRPHSGGGFPASSAFPSSGGFPSYTDRSPSHSRPQEYAQRASSPPSFSRYNEPERPPLQPLPQQRRRSPSPQMVASTAVRREKMGPLSGVAPPPFLAEPRDGPPGFEHMVKPPPGKFTPPPGFTPPPSTEGSVQLTSNVLAENTMRLLESRGNEPIADVDFAAIYLKGCNSSISGALEKTGGPGVIFNKMATRNPNLIVRQTRDGAELLRKDLPEFIAKPRESNASKSRPTGGTDLVEAELVLAEKIFDFVLDKGGECLFNEVIAFMNMDRRSTYDVIGRFGRFLRLTFTGDKDKNTVTCLERPAVSGGERGSSRDSPSTSTASDGRPQHYHFQHSIKNLQELQDEEKVKLTHFVDFNYMYVLLEKDWKKSEEGENLWRAHSRLPRISAAEWREGDAACLVVAGERIGHRATVVWKDDNSLGLLLVDSGEEVEVTANEIVPLAAVFRTPSLALRVNLRVRAIPGREDELKSEGAEFSEKAMSPSSDLTLIPLQLRDGVVIGRLELRSPQLRYTVKVPDRLHKAGIVE